MRPAWVRVAAVAAVLLGFAVGGLMGLSVSQVRVAEAAPTRQQSTDIARDLLGVSGPDSVAEVFVELAGDSW